ncbi:hypothetical protein BV22DRAFT_554170 [Leucogyrophana mollusca]|uniref:Uncharacterized protein n=1 Tax=Leucogyrophana mollusca TaxID=85980 RepID=A0ACB8BGD5_9AGAM|nr:hypothetical protein BV22DRAFT_554170 [Leucogyrophana mollusca]
MAVPGKRKSIKWFGGPTTDTIRLGEGAVYISTKSSSAPIYELHAMSDPNSLIQALYQTQSLVYLTMATGAAVTYDQVLNFSQEVDHIWNRRWGPTTALYLVARYSGSVFVFTNIASIVRLNWTLKVIKIIYIIVGWSLNVFLTAMQAILLMRVFALCGRSKTVLIFLSACFVCQTVVVVALSAKQFNFSFIGHSILSMGPAIGSVGQEIDKDISIFGFLPAAQACVQLAFDTVLFGFALSVFSRHALEARALGGGWSVNPLVKFLTADQTLYFLWCAFRPPPLAPLRLLSVAPPATRYGKHSASPKRSPGSRSPRCSMS